MESIKPADTQEEEEEKKVAHDEMDPHNIKQDDFFYKIKELNP
jgi:hypothetical protein